MKTDKRSEELEQQLRERDQLIEEQKHYITQLQEDIGKLEERLAKLEAQLAKDSRNSSKPPSSDGFKRRHYPKRTPSTKPTGGQKGHEGHTLQRSEKPDIVIPHRPEVCSECQTLLKEIPGEISETRQVMDIPPPANLIVTEHRIERVKCPQCGKQTTGTFPQDVKAEVQYGPEVKSYAVYLHHAQYLSLERTCEALEDLTGVHISEGTVSTWIQEAAEEARPLVEEIKEQLIQSPQMGGDETGIRIGGKLHWVHVASTKTLTHLAWHRKRGRKAMNAIGILPNYHGKAMHDRLASYDIYPCQHRLCKAHIIRDLTYLVDIEKLLWPALMRTLLAEMHQAAQEWHQRGENCFPGPERAEWIDLYDTILALGYQQLSPPPEKAPHQRGKPKQSKAKLLLEVLDKRREQVIGFLDDTSEDFTNNQREQDLRMLKVKEKISGGFRSDAGATAFCTLRSVVSTLRKQEHRALEIIRSLFFHNPISLALSSQ